VLDANAPRSQGAWRSHPPPERPSRKFSEVEPAGDPFRRIPMRSGIGHSQLDTRMWKKIVGAVLAIVLLIAAAGSLFVFPQAGHGAPPAIQVR